jgi:DNA-binding LytR/AlgR family response regulator
VLRQYIGQTPSLVFAGECGNAIEALAFLQKETVDLVFLDIQMPRLKGTELAKLLPASSKIIFTTAHAEYALQGYELDAVDYLLKPVQFERFLKAVNKLFRLSPAGIPALNAPGVPPKKEPFIYLRADRKMVKVLLNRISYVESMKDYVKVVTSEGTIITKQSITAMAAMLPEDEFLRIHRSFIVNTARIDAYTNEIVTVGKSELPIGKLFRNGVLKSLEAVRSC